MCNNLNVKEYSYYIKICKGDIALKKTVSFVVALMMILSLISCTQNKVETLGDQLKTGVWQGAGEYMTTITLSFDEIRAKIEIKSFGGAKYVVEGVAVVDDGKIVITDEESNKNFLFEYRIQGNKLEIEYEEQIVTLDKVE